MRLRKTTSTRLAWVSLTLMAAGVAIAAAARPVATSQAVLVERQRYAMGTVFRVVARTDAAAAERAIEAVEKSLDEVTRLEGVLSHYDPRSELSRLSGHHAGAIVTVSSDLYDALERSLAMTRLSGGRFDVTVGPLVRLWRDREDPGRRPSATDLAAVTPCVGSDLVVLEPPAHVRIRSACLALDLGGIGKGIGVDRAVGVLQSHGVRHAIVNAGGSTMRAIGLAPDGPGWPVQTVGRGDDVLWLQDASLSTSQASGEVIVPDLLEPVAGAATVTVLAPEAATADALSTALLLSTLAEGRRMLRHIPDASVWWADADGTLVARHLPATDAVTTRAGATP